MTKRRLTKLTVTKVRLIRRGRDWPPLFPIQPDSQTLLLSTLSSRINNFRERVHCASKYLDFSLRGKDDPPNYCDLANLSETDAFRFPLRLLAIRSSSSLLHIPSESNKSAKRSPHLDLRWIYIVSSSRKSRPLLALLALVVTPSCLSHSLEEWKGALSSRL